MNQEELYNLFVASALSGYMSKLDVKVIDATKEMKVIDMQGNEQTILVKPTFQGEGIPSQKFIAHYVCSVAKAVLEERNYKWNEIKGEQV